MFLRYQCPPVLFDLLGHHELAVLNQVNRSLHAETKDAVKKRRIVRLHEIISLFHIPLFAMFATNRTFSTPYYTRSALIRSLLRLAPELVEFMESKELEVVEFVPTVSEPWEMDKDELRAAWEVIIPYVKRSRSIHSFQFELFHSVVTHQDVKEMVRDHPSLTILYLFNDHHIPLRLYSASHHPYF